MDVYIGTIMMFAGTYAPSGWAFCNGQMLSISQYQALFALLGTTYGGNGSTTFGLPNLQGRVPVHAGQLAGGGSYVLGQTSGTENVTLISSQMPTHTHMVAPPVQSGLGDQASAVNYYPASFGKGGTQAYSDTTNATGGQFATAAVGGSQPHSNLQPYQVVNFIIALQGIYPPRS